MSKIIVIETLNEYNGMLNVEAFEVFSDMEFNELLSSYKEEYPTIKIYEGTDKLEYFKNEVEFMQRYNIGDTYHYLFHEKSGFNEFINHSKK